MASIEIDFDVFKELTMRRKDESTTYNDVLRELLGLASQREPLRLAPRSAGRGSVYMQGLEFPEGTKFRVTYKGRPYSAEIKNGQWVGEDGIVRKSPSDAASAITQTNVNGWRFWDFQQPGETSWSKMRVLQSAR